MGSQDDNDRDEKIGQLIAAVAGIERDLGRVGRLARWAIGLMFPVVVGGIAWITVSTFEHTAERRLAVQERAQIRLDFAAHREDGHAADEAELSRIREELARMTGALEQWQRSSERRIDVLETDLRRRRPRAFEE